MEKKIQKAKHGTLGTFVQKIKLPQMCTGG